MTGTDRPVGHTRPPHHRLVFLVDVPGWAYDNIADQITPGLAAAFDVTRLYVRDFPDIADLLGAIMDIRPPAILHVFWRPILFDLIDPVVVRRCEARRGLPDGQALAAMARLVLTTSVYDHLGLDPAAAQRQARILQAMDAYSTASPILDAIYRALPDMPAPSAMLADGVDLDFYHPERLERLDETHRPFRIGWVGNSQWGFLEGLPDAKGVESVIRPAIDILKSDGIAVELVLIDRAQKWRPRAEVAAFYHTIDVYLCASLIEGTPNPVLEAMASGVPIVSTDVGVVRHSFGPEQAEFIIDRDPRAFAQAIRNILVTPGLRARLSAENLRFIQKQSWACRHADWMCFFASAVSIQSDERKNSRIAALENAAANLQPDMKMRVRSFLRRSPQLYSFVSRIVHFASQFVGILRLRCRKALDRVRRLSR